MRHELERTPTRVPPRERLAGIHAKAAQIGLPNPRLDMKVYADEMWDDA